VEGNQTLIIAEDGTYVIYKEEEKGIECIASIADPD